MFTGIITAIGEVAALKDTGTTRWFRIKSPYQAEGIALGASVAHDGVCLTVIAKEGFTYDLEASLESMNLTTCGTWQVGSKLNLERALKVGDELGGHWVLGHVDGMAKVVSRVEQDGTALWRFKSPAEFTPFLAKKGSVTLNGTSLTINDVIGDEFKVTMIPHTLQVTTWGGVKVGDNINLEIDTIARYAANWVKR